MPYLVRGKCVYKKKPNGGQGELVGCTKGDVKDYLAALHIHAVSGERFKRLFKQKNLRGYNGSNK